MSHWGAVGMAFSVGAIFTWIELRTSKYPCTGFLIAWKRPFLTYCCIYGLIASVGFLFSDFLIKGQKLKIEGLGLESPYVLAFVIGLSSKAIMQLSIYSVTTGASTFPIGFQTVVQLFEPHLLRLILLEDFNEVRNYVRPYAQNHSDLDAVKKMIMRNVPTSLSQQERAAFENEIDKDTHINEAMERFLRFLGRKTFLRVFDSPVPQAPIQPAV